MHFFMSVPIFPTLGQTVATALLIGTPMVYGFKEDITGKICTGDWVRVDTDQGAVEVIKKGV